MDLKIVRSFAMRYTAAWCSQDPTSVASFFDETGWLKINQSSPAVGRAAIARAALSFMSAFPDMIVMMDDLKGEDDHFIYRWTLTGTNTGPGGTGNSIKISGYEEWTFGPDGLILESRGHFDEADYQQQLQSEAPNTDAPIIA